MKKRNQTTDTYKRATSLLMSHLLFSFLRKEHDFSSSKNGYWHLNVLTPIPEGALVVPFALTYAAEWWIGWYRGKDEKGYDLVESVETRKVMRFFNCGFLFLDNVEFSNKPSYHYSDRQYEIIDKIEKRVARHNYWFVVGNPVFHEYGGIEVPIRQKFHDKFYSKTYKNLREMTIAALDQQCEECRALEKETEGGEK